MAAMAQAAATKAKRRTGTGVLLVWSVVDAGSIGVHAPHFSYTGTEVEESPAAGSLAFQTERS